jgi:hypothetical protein
MAYAVIKVIKVLSHALPPSHPSVLWDTQTMGSQDHDSEHMMYVRQS